MGGLPLAALGYVFQLLAWRYFNGGILTFKGHGNILPDGSRTGTNSTLHRISAKEIKKKRQAAQRVQSSEADVADPTDDVEEAALDLTGVIEQVLDEVQEKENAPSPHSEGHLAQGDLVQVLYRSEKSHRTWRTKSGKSGKSSLSLKSKGAEEESEADDLRKSQESQEPEVQKIPVSNTGLSRAEPSQLQKLLSRAASLFQSAPTECEEVVAQKSGTREVLPVPSTPPMHSEPSVACEHSTV